MQTARSFLLTSFAVVGLATSISLAQPERNRDDTPPRAPRESAREDRAQSEHRADRGPDRREHFADRDRADKRQHDRRMDSRPPRPRDDAHRGPDRRPDDRRADDRQFDGRRPEGRGFNDRGRDDRRFDDRREPPRREFRGHDDHQQDRRAPEPRGHGDRRFDQHDDRADRDAGPGREMRRPPLPPEARERIRERMRDMPPERREMFRERIRERTMPPRDDGPRGDFGPRREFRGGPEFGPRSAPPMPRGPESRRGDDRRPSFDDRRPMPRDRDDLRDDRPSLPREQLRERSRAEEDGPRRREAGRPPMRRDRDMRE